MSHTWMSFVTHMNRSHHTYEWVMSHIWMSHVTHMNESCYTYEWTYQRSCIAAYMCGRACGCAYMSGSLYVHVWVCVRVRVWGRESEGVMSHIWMSHVTHMNALSRGVASSIYGVEERMFVRERHRERKCVRERARTRRTSVYVCVCVGGGELLCMCVCMCERVWERGNESCHAWKWVMPTCQIVWMRRVTHINESYHTYSWLMSRVWMSHVTHTLGTRWQCHVQNVWMSHVAHRNESCHTWTSRVTHMNESCHTCEWVMSHIWMSHVTHMNVSCRIMSQVWMSHVTNMSESCHTCEWVMSRK